VIETLLNGAPDGNVGFFEGEIALVGTREGEREGFIVGLFVFLVGLGERTTVGEAVSLIANTGGAVITDG
jgi:hypothetical protein